MMAQDAAPTTTVSATSLLSTPHKGLRPLSPSSQPRLGSRSPNSIPSSPTSVHSSSSAIFERDIEPLPPSLASHHLIPHAPSNPPHPHRTPRARASEPIDAAVPSVLTSAAAVLTSLPTPPAAATASPTQQADDPFAAVSIIAPSNILPSSSLPSPTSSPSPTSRTLPLPHQQPPSRSATLPPTGSPPSIAAALAEPSVHDQSQPPAAAAADARARNRLSFISYNDLLLSAPVSTVPLASITQPASRAPPPHLAAVEGAVPGPSSGLGMGSTSRNRSVRASMVLDKDLGGEWEREGLGRGLEERLEALLRADPAPAPLPAPSPAAQVIVVPPPPRAAVVVEPTPN